MKKLLVLTLASLLAFPVGASSASTGTVSGRVVPASDTPPLKAIWVAPSSGSAPITAPIAANGSFAVEGIPAGTAELAVETTAGLYVVSTPVAIAPGTTRQIQLALGGRQDTPVPAGEPPKKKKRAGGVWANPVYATLIVVGSAIVVGLLVNELTKSSGNNNASPSTTDQ